MKIADKKVPAGESPQKKASDIHAELAKHIAAGDHQKAYRASRELSDHIQTHGVKGDDSKKAEYAGHLKDLKTSYNKTYAKTALAKLRGEKSD
jgi:hypothetical protein